MKQFLQIVILLFGIQFSSWAQNDSISKIDISEDVLTLYRIANKRPPDQFYKYEHLFDGTIFVELIKDNTGLIITKIEDIDWAKFWDIKTYEAESNLITIFVYFKTKLYKYIEQRDSDDKPYSRRESTTDFISLKIPRSEQSKIEQIKAVAEKLHQLALAGHPVLKIENSKRPTYTSSEREIAKIIEILMKNIKKNSNDINFKVDDFGFELFFFRYEGDQKLQFRRRIAYKKLKGINLEDNEIIFKGEAETNPVNSYKSTKEENLIFEFDKSKISDEKLRGLLGLLKYIVWTKGVDLPPLAF